LANLKNRHAHNNVIKMPKFPRVRVWWIKKRGVDHDFIKFKKPSLHLGLGQKDTGKSALLEAIGVQGYANIIDLFGSRDNEGLSWCRSPLDKILFITGDSVDIKCSWNTIRISDLTLNDIRRHEVSLTVSAFHATRSMEFLGLNKIIDVLYRRYSWQKVQYVMVREASNFIFSRLKVALNQTLAKADFLYLTREARHMGYAMGIDTIRWTGIDADVRGVADYVILKAVGIEGLPKSLRWVYKYIKPKSLMRVHPRAFALISRKGPVGFCTFDFPKWHKLEGENMLDLFDLHPEYGDTPDYGDQARHTVSDFEHKDIIVAYFSEKSPVRGSMAKVAKQFVRSPATINDHIKEHDKGIDLHGFCPRCRRVRGPLEGRRVGKDRRTTPVYDEVHSWEELQKTFAMT